MLKVLQMTPFGRVCDECGPWGGSCELRIVRDTETPISINNHSVNLHISQQATVYSVWEKQGATMLL